LLAALTVESWNEIHMRPLLPDTAGLGSKYGGQYRFKRLRLCSPSRLFITQLLDLCRAENGKDHSEH
jgi:hypothetical protein